MASLLFLLCLSTWCRKLIGSKRDRTDTVKYIDRYKVNGQKERGWNPDYTQRALKRRSRQLSRELALNVAYNLDVLGNFFSRTSLTRQPVTPQSV